MSISTAGAAGCVLGGKLSDASRPLPILMVESGRNSLNDPNIVRPGRYRSNFDPENGYFERIEAQLKHCGDREMSFKVPIY